MEQKQQLQTTTQEKNLSDIVKNRIYELVSQKRIDLPANYSVGNAITQAWLIIQDTKDTNGIPVLKSCTKESIVNAMLDMAIMGLNPNKHGWFIPFGNKLRWYTSVYGKSAVTKRIKGVENEPIGTIIYDGDEIELGFNELGEEIVTSHKSSWNNKLKGVRTGVYATCIVRGIKRSALMTMEEVKEAWMKNPSKKNNKDHVDFQGEFMKRTAIGRLTKTIIKTSNDDDLLADVFVRNEDENIRLSESEYSTVDDEIETNANQGEQLSFSNYDAEELEQEEQKEQVLDDVVEEYVKYSEQKTPQQATSKKSYF